MHVCAASAINNYCVHVNYYFLRKQLALVRIPRASKQLIVILRLRDTVWNMFHTQNVITHSAHLHLTTVTNDGAQIERHLVCTHIQKE